ncbi:SIR2 family protein [Rhodanobacter sp. PCA2]|uniref:SIR2 family protein n=1 Tax=Rhodanobacter sp. PCA2 TaxID=2006117 RepID=UPI0015E69FAA|nr:SIR2 family protein [Rhodanobacter sp. PCA2]MBA2079170.1 fibronectin-binding protein (FBP) [Rhodanobacter sp. PCA2]
MELKAHGYVVGSNSEWLDDLPAEGNDLDNLIKKARRHIEPWLSAVFQAEHLNLLVGSGFSVALAALAHAAGAGMGYEDLGTTFDEKIKAHAEKTAAAMGRGNPNIEDQIRSTLVLVEALDLTGKAERAAEIKAALDARLKDFLNAVLETERGIATAEDAHWKDTVSVLQSFLLSFASRSSSRERLHVFTTNYDRLIEYGCDLAGLRTIDRFVGALEPVFRSSRLDVDYHYNPPGIRGEPRFMEGVLRLSKLHGSLDWHLDPRTRRIVRRGISFGADADHPAVPDNPVDTVMIYPNASKDVETSAYPYAELFRDFAAALCRPNAALVVYGYGFGDDHINRVLADMLSLPSTHLVVFAYSVDERIKHFLAQVARPAQISLLVGSHFSNLRQIVEHYLPKPAIDQVTSRMAELLKNRAPIKQDEAAAANEAANNGDEE